MSWRSCSTNAVAIVLLAMPIAVAGLARPRGGDRQGEGTATRPDEAVAVAEARLKLSRKALDVIRRPARHGAQVVGRPEDYYRWSYRLLGDQIYLSMPEGEPRVADPEIYFALSHARTSPGRVAAFKEHRQRMEELESMMRPRHERGILSNLEFLDVQSHRLEAEPWLARERAKGDREMAEAEGGP
jgi:hypothetical protein